MALLPGTRLAQYEIVAAIGTGGMGEVYRARDTKLKRDVAIKSLPQSFAQDDERLKRFRREAELLASLNDPHIAQIYDLIEVDSSTYLVLELVEGETLADRLKRGRVPMAEALQLAKQIASALETTHQLDIVHRDLKPANIKITAGGVVKLLDFGIARRQTTADDEATASGRLTATGGIYGTAQYMSPEQVRGESVGLWSDQFSLGIILFEMLTGRRPFSGNSSGEMLAAILRDKPPALAEIDPAIPSPIQWIVDRCLSKQPKDRYASTRDLTRDLAMLSERLMQAQPALSTLARSTLPAPRTPLVGRDEEFAAARALLLRDDVRLVTFTGAAGTGKTRLAVQVAADVQREFSAGVFFVALAAIADPAQVPLTIMHIIGAREMAGRSPTEALKETLREVASPVLLLLDNFEQVLDAAPLLTDLLEGCPRLKILVTSRAVLRMYGEHEFEVPPLELSSSIALFSQRAAAVKPDFALTQENAASISEICSRLDGLPLAIELAAARVRTLTPRAMLKRLESRFELLTGGARDLPQRQQTLRAAVEWSYTLLTAAEQKLFRRLAVFVHGCTLEAVEAVCNATEDLGATVLDGMESLVGKSLISQTQMPDGETRFTMLETIRDYAAERLRASPDETVTRRAHAAYCLVLAEEGAAQLTPAETQLWLERCSLEYANLREAIEWAIQAKQAEWGLRLGAALFPFWVARERYGDGRERLSALLNLESSGEARKARTRALHAAGNLAFLQADYSAALRLHHEVLALSRVMGDGAGTVMSLASVAVDEHALGNLKTAHSILDECLKRLHEAGDESLVAQMLNNVAFSLDAKGDFAAAKPLCEQALTIFVRLNDLAGTAQMQSRLGDLERKLANLSAAGTWYERALADFEKLDDRGGLARTRMDISVLLFEQGKHREAHTMLAQALASFRDLENRLGVARALEEFAGFAAAAGKPERAIRLAAAANAIRHSVGAREVSTEPRRFDAARESLGSHALEAEMSGWSMTMEAAIRYALEEETTSRN